MDIVNGWGEGHWKGNVDENRRGKVGGNGGREYWDRQLESRGSSGIS